MNLSKEDYDVVKQFDSILHTACYCNFVRITKREDAVELDKIYKKVFHTDRGLLGGCNHCVYEACKKLGKLYFEDKKAYEAAENKKNAENEAKTEQKEPKTAPKAKKTAKKKK